MNIYALITDLISHIGEHCSTSSWDTFLVDLSRATLTSFGDADLVFNASFVFAS